MANELQADYARFVRAIREVSQERSMHILVAIACIVAIISWFRAEKAIDSANQAQATAEVWQTLYSETERECRLAQMEIDDFRIVLNRAGLDPSHVGEKP